MFFALNFVGTLRCRVLLIYSVLSCTLRQVKCTLPRVTCTLSQVTCTLPFSSVILRPLSAPFVNVDRKHIKPEEFTKLLNIKNAEILL